MSLIDRIDRLRLAYHDHVREVAWVDGVEDAYALVAPAPGPTELETARELVEAIRALIDAAPPVDPAEGLRLLEDAQYRLSKDIRDLRRYDQSSWDGEVANALEPLLAALRAASSEGQG